MRLSLIWCLLLSQVDSLFGARILAVLPIPGKSHFSITSTVLQALADRGHEVVMYSPFKPSSSNKNLKQFEIHSEFEEDLKRLNTFDDFMALAKSRSYWGLSGAQIIWYMGSGICEDTLANPKIKELLASGQKFEIFLTEALFGNECLLAIGHAFNAITIDVSTFGPWSVVNRVLGNSLQISYHPEANALDLKQPMGFVDRLRNFVSVTTTLALYYYMHLPRHQQIIDRTMKGRNIPPVEDMVANISLTLANFHPTIASPWAISPNIVPVGGLHIPQTLPPLPKDIKEFMDSGKNSVIYFSLGSVVPVHIMPQHYIQAFVKTFSKLPYKVLWKIEADSVPDLPKNVMITKWAPQQSVLAHPNCVLFVTHGGLLSQLEAFHYGVPVVGIPFFGDQPHNVLVYEQLGVGVVLDFFTLTEQTFTKAILSVAGKPQFIENAKRISTLSRHRAMSPVDTAVFWVEYALRHDSAPHLRPRAATMPLYQLWLLDILGAALLSVFVSVMIIKAIVTAICCRRKQAVVTSGKKKN